MNNPSPLEFLREGVLFYEPIVISNLINDWTAIDRWNFKYLKEKCQGEYSINVTPHGYADCVLEEQQQEEQKEEKEVKERGEKINHSYFFYPSEVKMSMELFLEMISNPQRNDAVPYLSQQNNNLVNYFPELLEDIEPSLPLAIDAFGGTLPEALNLWIGDERSVSSLHKDHFENMYAVISGEKIFTLFPPTDIAFLGEAIYPTKRYHYVKNDGNNVSSVVTTRIKKEDLISTSEGCPSYELPWIKVDPEDSNALNLQPSLKYATPIRVKVQAGEVLYIPSMWYHRVTQSCPTIAVNFWYEQQFNFRYVFYQLSRSITYPPTSPKESEKTNEEDNEILK